MSAATGALTRYAAPLVAGLATCSTLATIGPVFSNQRWLLTSITVVAVIVLSGIGLRAVGVAQAYVSLIQLVLGIYALLLLTCQPTMIAGFTLASAAYAAITVAMTMSVTAHHLDGVRSPADTAGIAVLCVAYLGWCLVRWRMVEIRQARIEQVKEALR